MNVAAPQVLDVQRYIQQNVQSLLNTHGSDIAHQVALAVLQIGDWRNSLESIQIRSVPDNENVLRSDAAPGRRQVSGTLVRGHHHVAEAISLPLQPYLNIVEQSLLLILGNI